jgi:hypothetical protein
MKRSRARVLARRREPPFHWIGPLLATALALLAMRAMAETSPPAPLPPKTGETGPMTAAPPSTPELNRGVIRPPTTTDPGMNRGTPNAEKFPTPVLPPPGTPGGNPRVTPK